MDPGGFPPKCNILKMKNGLSEADANTCAHIPVDCFRRRHQHLTNTSTHSNASSCCPGTKEQQRACVVPGRVEAKSPVVVSLHIEHGGPWTALWLVGTELLYRTADLAVNANDVTKPQEHFTRSTKSYLQPQPSTHSSKCRVGPVKVYLVDSKHAVQAVEETLHLILRLNHGQREQALCPQTGRPGRSLQNQKMEWCVSGVGQLTTH